MALESMPATPATLLARLKPLREKLIDVSLRNRLLNFRDLGSQALPLRPVDTSRLYECLVLDERHLHVEGTPELEEEEDETEDPQGRRVESPKPKLAVDFSGEDATQDLEEGTLRARDTMTRTEARMTSLYRKYRECLEAFGSNLCYMALGFLEWTDPHRTETEQLYAPLILVPVSLERSKRQMFEAGLGFALKADEFPRRRGRGNQRAHPLETTAYRFTLRHDGEDILDNVALRLKLQTLPGGPVLPEFDSESEELDLEDYFEAVERMISKLPPEANDGWKVIRAARLAFFTSSKEAMYRDLDPQAWPKTGLIQNEWIQAALDGREPDEEHEVGDDELTNALHVDPVPTVVSTDSSQMRAIVRVLRGQSLVIQGPPGTGKSQTITNLIATTLQAGKSVLFVAEKMAALSVVRENLKRVGLGVYCLELHSAKATPKQVIAQVQARLAHHPNGDLAFAQHAAHLQRMNLHRTALSGYGQAITMRSGSLDISFHTAVWRHSQARHDVARLFPEESNELDSVPALSLPHEPGHEDLGALIDSLKVASRCIAEGVHLAAAPWKGTCPRQYPTPQIEHTVTQALSAARKSVLAWQDAESNVPEHSLWPQMTASQWISVHTEFDPDSAPLLPSVICQRIRADFSNSEEYRRYSAAVKLWRVPCADEARSLSEKLTIKDTSIECAQVAVERLQRALLSRLNVETVASVIASGEQVSWLHESLQERTRALDEIAKLAEIAQRSEIFHDGSELAALAQELARQPLGTWRSLHMALLRPASPQQLASALVRRSTLTDEEKALQQTLHLKDLPESGTLTALIREIRLTANGWFNWLPGTRGYKLRRELRSYFQKRVRIEADAVLMLERVLEWRTAAESFANDNDTKALLGPAFIGLQTDWPALENASSLCQRWSQKFGLVSAQKLITDKEPISDAAPSISELAAQIAAVDPDIIALAAVLFNQDQPTLANLSERALLADVSLQAHDAESIVSKIQVVALPPQTNTSDVPTLCATALRLRQCKAEVDELVSEPDFLGELHQGMLATDLDIIDGAMNWIDQVIWSAGLPMEIKLWILAESPSARAHEITQGIHGVTQQISNWRTELRRLEEVLSIEWDAAPLSASGIERTSGTLLENIEQALAAVPSLGPWFQLRECEQEIGRAGGTDVWRWCRDRETSSDVTELVGHLAFWNRICADFINRHPILETYHRQKLEEHRGGFRSSDCEVGSRFKQTVDHAIYKPERTADQGQRQGSTKSYTGMALLRHQIGLTRSHVPVRRMLRQSGAALKHLMPCWMLGPQAVAQFLEPEQIEFDLLIIDEASQVRPEDALGALARAKQVVIVGDSKQMPPTDVFRAIGAGEADDVEDEEGEMIDVHGPALGLDSILDLFEAQLPAEMLQWHYRSQHQQLIAFSNEYFYGGKLIVPPSRWHQSEALGIRRHFVDGRLQDRKNPAEAEEVVALMREHVLREALQDVKKRETLGVVAMNSEQQSLIQDRWEAACKADSELEEAYNAFTRDTFPLFVRNLENVQGDERDVIIISATYGKNAAGQMFQRFGPINKLGGWRRLNVLFTRARKRIHLVTSMVHSDVQPAVGTQDSGRGYLRKYLQFAETGHLPDSGAGTVKNIPDSGFELSVAQCISGLGFELHYQVGVQGFFIDIGVVHPNGDRYLCGIECDGAAYHSHPVARDRDRIRQEILEQRGWEIYRIWSTDWYRNNKAEIERLRQQLERLFKAS